MKKVKEIAMLKAGLVTKRVTASTRSSRRHPVNTRIGSFKSGGGNGPILLLKGSVPVQEGDTQQLYQGPPSSFLEGITLQEKLKGMHT